MKFSTDVHVPVRMNPNTFGDPETFHVATLSDENIICPIFRLMNANYQMLAC